MDRGFSFSAKEMRRGIPDCGTGTPYRIYMYDVRRRLFL